MHSKWLNDTLTDYSAQSRRRRPSTSSRALTPPRENSVVIRPRFLSEGGSVGSICSSLVQTFALKRRQPGEQHDGLCHAPLSVGQQFVSSGDTLDLRGRRPDRRPRWAGYRFRSGGSETIVGSTSLLVDGSDKLPRTVVPNGRENSSRHLIAKNKGAGVANETETGEAEGIAAAPRRLRTFRLAQKWAGPLKSTEESTPCLGFEAARARHCSQEKGAMEDAQQRWPYLTDFDLSTIKNRSSSGPL